MTNPTTFTGLPVHGTVPQRGLDITPSSSSHNGRYGRMFRDLPTYDIADASLVALAKLMVQELENGELDRDLRDPRPDDDENTGTMNGELRLPAGYTYFGQFVDHDITFDPISSLSRQNDPDGLVNFRTPRFDLDSLYGRGPADQPYLYQDDGVHLQEGELRGEDARVNGPDLPRAANTKAIIGDPRNDENLIVSQLQVAMIRFHNHVADEAFVKHPGWSADDVFKVCQQTVRWHYQWIVINDFLPRLVGSEVVEDILPPTPYKTTVGPDPQIPKPNLRFYDWKNDPFMPLEFAVAAYRYGHSQIRPSYLINDVVGTRPPIPGVHRISVFRQDGEPTQSLNGFRVLPVFWGVQWKFLLANITGSDPTDTKLPQPSYRLDATIAHPLGALNKDAAGPQQIASGFSPEIAQSLAVRNLLRGKRLGLPSGQDVARAMGIEPLSENKMFDEGTLPEEVRKDLAGRAPLWYYILREADKVAGGEKLGPVGGRIVAEVLVGLLVGDSLSYINVEPNWKPSLGEKESFTLSDLINFAIPSVGSPAQPAAKKQDA
jgi:hypothetical protein